MITIQKYAETRGVSGSAVRAQIARYAKELDGHVIKDGRRRVLDDVAVSFLDRHRKPAAVVVDGESVSLFEEVTALKEEVERLKEGEITRQLESLKNELNFYKGKVIEMQEEMIALVKYKDESQRLLIDNQKKDAEIEEVRLALDQKDDELSDISTRLRESMAREEDARKEAESYQKSWFGFYRKVKL